MECVNCFYNNNLLLLGVYVSNDGTGGFYSVCVYWHSALRHFTLFEYADLLHPVPQCIPSEAEEPCRFGLIVPRHGKRLPQ